MQVASEMNEPFAIDPNEYVNQREEYLEKRDEFMMKYLHRHWPGRIIWILGLFQLLISLAILGVDLPIILMFGPRWEVFAGCWTFVLGFIACVSTFHSCRKKTWLKLKWGAALNILAGIAAGVMVGFNILFSINPYICLVSTGCKYNWYTYSAAGPYYTGSAILGVALLVTTFIYLIFFVKNGVGGITVFENIQKGWVPDMDRPDIPTAAALAKSRQPITGAGVGGQSKYAATVPRFPPPPPPGMRPGFPPGFMPRPPPPPGVPTGYAPIQPGVRPMGPPPPGMPPGMMRPMGPPPPGMPPGPYGPLQPGVRPMGPPQPITVPPPPPQQNR